MPERRWTLAGFSVRQRVLVNLLFLVCVAGGILALVRLPVEAYPDMSFDQVVVQTFWYGASPSEMETRVTRPIEDELERVRGLTRITSYSQADISRIVVKFDESLSGAQFRESYDELRAAVDRVTTLPDAAEAPEIVKVTVEEIFPTINVVVQDVGGVGEHVLRAIARRVRRDLREIEGVRDVKKEAIREREFRVRLDPEALERYGLTVAGVAAQIRAQSLSVPAGDLARQAGEFRLRTTGQARTIPELEALVIVPNAPGTPVRLEALGTITAVLQARLVGTRFNGNPAILLGVAKNRDANALNMVEDLDAALEKLNQQVPAGIVLATAIDSTQIIRSRLRVLRNNLLLGVGLVFIVLWFFLGGRNATLAIIGIPFSFLVAMIFLRVLGVSINALSLFALVLVSGMVVDDAIIVIENIYRKIEAGDPLRVAVVQGAQEVSIPVIASVTTTIGAFLPLLVAQGVVGEFFAIIPKTVAVALAASLFECLVILPAHYYTHGRRAKRPAIAGITHAPPRLALATRWLLPIKQVYERLLRRLVAARYAAVAAFLAFGLLVGLLAMRLGRELFPSDFQMGMVNVELAPDASLEETEEALSAVGRIVATLRPELVRDYTEVAGFYWDADQQQHLLANIGQIDVEFADSAAITRDPDVVTRQLRELLSRRFAAGAFAPYRVERIEVAPITDGPPLGKPVSVRIETPNFQVAGLLAREIEAELARIPGVVDVGDNLRRGAEEVRFSLRQPQASQYGVTTADLARALAAANDGALAQVVTDPSKDDDATVKVELTGAARVTLTDLMHLRVRGRSAQGPLLVPLFEVARTTTLREYARIYHYDGRRTVIVTANIQDVAGQPVVTSEAVNTKLRAAFRDVGDRYPGVRLRFGGEFEETAKTFESMFEALGIAALVIFLILATQFRSYAQPIIIMMTIPFGYVGVVVGLWVFDQPVTITTMIAIVGLAGVIVNDSLVLIDFINRSRRDHPQRPVVEAVVEAARVRMRPVFLTTITTALGLLPMAIGIPGYSKVWSPFATSIVWGMGFALVLTLILLPCLYLILEDWRRIMARLFRFHRVPDPGLPAVDAPIIAARAETPPPPTVPAAPESPPATAPAPPAPAGDRPEPPTIPDAQSD